MTFYEDALSLLSQLCVNARSFLPLTVVCSDHLFKQCWVPAGMLLEAQSLHVDALVAFSVALSIEPDYVPSMVSIAAVLRMFGGKSLSLARSFLMNALRLEPTNYNAWLNLGYISKAEGSLHQAADCFQAAYELRQSSPVQNFS